jgi:hypothetical protein
VHVYTRAVSLANFGNVFLRCPGGELLFCSVGGLAMVTWLNQPALFGGVEAGTECSGVIYGRSKLDAMNSS